jgi:hypothetical protein
MQGVPNARRIATLPRENAVLTGHVLQADYYL